MLALAMAAALELSFEDLPRLVRENNGQARGASALADSAAARSGHLRRSWYPEIAADAGGERFQTGDYSRRSEAYGGVEVSLNVFRGGRDLFESRSRRGLADAAAASARFTKAEELLEARRLYWELVSTRELAALTAEAQEQNGDHAKAAERRIRAGLAAETDRLEFELQSSVLAEEKESLLHEVKLIELALSARLGMPQETTFKTAEAVAHADDESLLSVEPSAAAPEAVILAGQGEAARASSRQAGLWWAPSVDLYGGRRLYTLRDRDFLERDLRDDSFVGARLRLPLFDGGEISEARSLRRRGEGLSLQAAQAALTARSELERAREELKHLHELIHNGQERVVKGRRYLSSVRDEYARGVKNSMDVLAASQRQLGWRRQEAERRRAHETAKAHLLMLLER